jgi:hypothetical protein
MGSNRKLPPYGWRHGTGYLHPEDVPPPGRPPPSFCPGPAYTFPVQGPGFWGPPPPPGFLEFAVPSQFQPLVQFYPPPGYSYDGGPPPGFGPPHAATWPKLQTQGPPPPKKDDDETLLQYKLEGGLVTGAALHYQPGKSVCFHVLGEPDTPLSKILKGDHDGYISKHIHQINENSSIEHVMDKLGAGMDGKMTQVIEKGAGKFWQGTTFEQGSEKAKEMLKKWGWGEAGMDPEIEPIWVVVQKKVEEKKDDKKCC